MIQKDKRENPVLQSLRVFCKKSVGLFSFNDNISNSSSTQSIQKETQKAPEFKSTPQPATPSFANVIRVDQNISGYNNMSYYYAGKMVAIISPCGVYSDVDNSYIGICFFFFQIY